MFENYIPVIWKIAKVIPLHEKALQEQYLITDLSRFYRQFLKL